MDRRNTTSLEKKSLFKRCDITSFGHGFRNLECNRKPVDTEDPPRGREHDHAGGPGDEDGVLRGDRRAGARALRDGARERRSSTAGGLGRGVGARDRGPALGRGCDALHCVRAGAGAGVRGEQRVRGGAACAARAAGGGGWGLSGAHAGGAPSVLLRPNSALINTCHDARFAPHVCANVNAG
jgi:hypothetical protein